MVNQNHCRRYAVVGMGAIGGFYGAMLQRSGCEVHFLCRSDYSVARDRGLQVTSLGDRWPILPIYAYDDPRAMPACDVVIVALKTTQNQILAEVLPLILAPTGVVVVLQNGLGVEAAAAAIVGGDRVIGGLCFICATKTGPAQVVHSDYGAVHLGEYGPGYAARGQTPRLEAIAADLAAAGVAVKLAEDLMLARWQKLAWNVPFNGLSVVLNARTDEMIADRSVRSLAEDLMAEVRLAAAACGRELSADFCDRLLADTEVMKPYYTSMKLDFDAGRPLEHEAIVGEPWRTGCRAGANLPLMGMLYRQLDFCDRRQPRR